MSSAIATLAFCDECADVKEPVAPVAARAAGRQMPGDHALMVHRQFLIERQQQFAIVRMLVVLPHDGLLHPC